MPKHRNDLQKVYQPESIEFQVSFNLLYEYQTTKERPKLIAKFSAKRKREGDEERDREKDRKKSHGKNSASGEKFLN